MREKKTSPKTATSKTATSKTATQQSVSRRRFLKGGAAALTAATIVPRHVLGGPGFVPPSEKLNIAVIGTGGRGKRLTGGFLNQKDVEVVAIADPNDREDYSRFYYRGLSGRYIVKDIIEKHYRKERGKNYGGCKDYVDFRELLEKEKNIDGVVVATPDHAHAMVTLAAMRRGKDVYCEKPLTHSVEEARKVAAVARETKVATQMGNQGNSSEGIRQVCEWIWDGAIGDVTEVHAWSDAGGWGDGRTKRPEDKPPVPKGFNWDLWLGPLKHRPYHPAYAPYNWRGWWAFGGGAVGDMACHNMDPAFAALKLGYPETIEASGAGVNSETTAWGSIIRYTFGKRDKMPAVKLTWYDGGLKPPRPEEFAPNQKFDGNGILMIGTKGKLLCGGWSRGPRLLPDERMKNYKQPKKTIARVSAHDRAWLDACKGGPKASSNFDYGSVLTETVLLGGVATQVGEKICWDAENMVAKGCPKADPLIRTQYREGWSL